MSYIKVWLHFVWSTKNREPFLTTGIRPAVFQHIKDNAKKKEIHLDFIGGYTDHVHCLISLGSGQEIEKIVQLIKGESSHWINKNKLTRARFGWQEEYFVASVSPSLVPKARKYIANQEEHHRARSFTDEFELFLKQAGFERIKG
jgi:REP element-mobilizing transposase RayT